MDQSWTQLETRCKLFEDYDNYIPLLKEAEVLLANRCSLFKQHHTILFRDNVKLNAFKLPSTFKSAISVHINGDEIPHIERDQWTFNANSTGPMTVEEGEPNYYTLGNGFIVFDKIPKSGSADIYYRANLQNTDNISKTVLLAPAINGAGNDWVYLDTTMGDQINGLDVKYYEGGGINTLQNITVNTTADLDDSDPLDLSQSVNFNFALANDQKDVTFQLYQGGGEWSSQSLSNTYFVRTGIIKHYRIKGPVIDNDHHIALCDYAIYVATAMTDPAISDKHLQIWEARIQEILNQNIDQELPRGMKEEI
jgi:hypothetical protein